MAFIAVAGQGIRAEREREGEDKNTFKKVPQTKDFDINIYPFSFLVRCRWLLTDEGSKHSAAPIIYKPKSFITTSTDVLHLFYPND